MNAFIKYHSLLAGIVFFSGLLVNQLYAQTAVPSTSSTLVTQPIPDRTVSFNVSDTGVYKPITWGLDLAWFSEENFRRGIAFMGAERVDIVRSSFMPALPLVNGDFQGSDLANLNDRLNMITQYLGTNAKVDVNDTPPIDASYESTVLNWANVLDASTRHHQEAGLTVVTVSTFNEVDFLAVQSGKTTLADDFYNVIGELRNNPRFDNIRIAGANTLNCDQALPWYNLLKDRLDEGNTHQLAGNFDSYASFYQAVRANGHHAANDELHNVIEAMVGVEYGMQTGIWWGTAELARGEFVKASDGRRLGYAEHRPNWTAASVYRNPEGRIQAFGGSSERQASVTTFRFVSKDRNVFYNGQGPQREYTLVMPGGTGYQQGQTNAECVINITSGDDIQPAINGRYVLVNRNSGKVMEVADGSTVAGANIRQGTFTGSTHQQWNVALVSTRIGGDFSYTMLTAVHSGKAVDVDSWSLDDGANINAWNDTKWGNQQWYLEYAGDGWFYIRNRHSAKCLVIADASVVSGANIVQWQKAGDFNQQWRFLPIGAAVEFNAPAAPTNLVATANAESVRLDWSASPDTDVDGYTIFRAESTGGPYQTIARNVKSTAFVDNTATISKQYFYSIRAVDRLLNRSAYSNEVSVTPTGTNDLVAHLHFEKNLLDNTINFNHSASHGAISYPGGKVGTSALGLNGSDTFVQLPPDVANQEEITIALWVYWKGGAVGQHLFDFGNDENESMFITPNSAGSQLIFVIQHDGAVQQLSANALPVNKWSHLAVTLDAAGARLYVNGVLENESDAFSLSPLDFKPVLNYVGRSQSSDPLFNGNIDDFRLYNYALPPEEIAAIAADVVTDISDAERNSEVELSVWPMPANGELHVTYANGKNQSLSTVTLLDINGMLLRHEQLHFNTQTKLDVSSLPCGVYILRVSNLEETQVKKIVVAK